MPDPYPLPLLPALILTVTLLLLQLLAGLPVSNNWLIGFIESLKATDEERLYLQQWVTHERASGTHIAHHYPPPDND